MLKRNQANAKKQVSGLRRGQQRFILGVTIPMVIYEIAIAIVKTRQYSNLFIKYHVRIV